MPQRMPVDVDALKALGRARGLDAVGVARAEVFASTREALEQRRAQGLNGSMGFTYRNPERATDPRRLLRDAHTLVVGAIGYRRRAPLPPAGANGRVARYAWEDHYCTLRRALGGIVDELRSHGWRATVVLDDNGLVDREAAYRAGLGWYGKNSNLLLPGKGSWFVLGSVVTDCDLPADAPVAEGCGSCHRCLDSCPTGAIVAPGVVDARRCLAWLVQAPGTFPPEHRSALGDRVYGCDDCQEVCPPNRRQEVAAAPPPGPAAEAWVPLLDLLAASDEELLDRHGRWYVHQREPRWLRRNALLALGNVGDAHDEAVLGCLTGYLGHPDPMLRAHATWAARRLGRDDLVSAAGPDEHPDVVAERVRPVRARRVVATAAGT
ncbi:MAG: tRNA epoxyqueuosine(34) reductase QueG [Acidimicrobiia bacterium]|nr:tRNA epoxyqueuosine(34) reductase QueG [Acidimicrobiia bacterium]